MGSIEDLEKYAKENNVPIMQKDGINFLKKYISGHNIKNILEIGSAIGYSAIQMALVNKEIKIVTIEKDEVRYKNYSYFSNSPLIYIFSRLCSSFNSRPVALQNDVNVHLPDKMNKQSGLMNLFDNKCVLWEVRMIWLSSYIKERKRIIFSVVS